MWVWDDSFRLKRELRESKRRRQRQRERDRERQWDTQSHTHTDVPTHNKIFSNYISFNISNSSRSRTLNSIQINSIYYSFTQFFDTLSSLHFPLLTTLLLFSFTLFLFAVSYTYFDFIVLFVIHWKQSIWYTNILITWNFVTSISSLFPVPSGQ